MGKRLGGHRIGGLHIDPKGPEELEKLNDELNDEASDLQQTAEGYAADVKTIESLIARVEATGLTEEHKKELIDQLEADRARLQEEARVEVEEPLEENQEALEEVIESAASMQEKESDVVRDLNGATMSEFSGSLQEAAEKASAEERKFNEVENAAAKDLQDRISMRRQADFEIFRH